MIIKHTTHTEMHKLTDTIHLAIEIEQVSTQPWHGKVTMVHDDGSKLTMWAFERPQYEALHAAMDAVRAQVAHRFTQLSGTVVTEMHGANDA